MTYGPVQSLFTNYNLHPSSAANHKSNNSRFSICKKILGKVEKLRAERGPATAAAASEKALGENICYSASARVAKYWSTGIDLLRATAAGCLNGIFGYFSLPKGGEPCCSS